MNPIKCPKCQEELGGNLVARLAAESKMSFKLIPKDGEKVTLRHIGSLMTSTDRLLTAIGRDLGQKTVVMLDDVNVESDGAIVIDMLIARLPEPPK